MENSIHDLINALQPSNSSERPLQNQQPSSSPFPLQTGVVVVEAETDDDDDNITRPTAVGTDDSEERRVRLQSEVKIESPAPVEIIRGLASEFLDHQSPKERNKYNIIGRGDDIVSKGLVTESQAQELLDMSYPHL